MTCEKKLNKKLAKWAGWLPRHRSCSNKSHMTNPLDMGCEPMPDFTQSLDACFKWLVPKMVHLELRYDCRKSPNGLDSYSAYTQDGHWSATGNAETPALALCRALEKLISDEVLCG